MSEFTTGIPLDILQKFCSTDIFRPSLQQITHDGQFAYATDGLLLVRTSSTFPVTEGDDAERLVASIRGLFEKNFPQEGSTAWTSEIPAGIPETEKCLTCGGTGKAQVCPSCDGEGEVSLDHSYQGTDQKWKHTTYEVECGLCEGQGKIGGTGDECEDCDGTGAVNKPTAVAFGIAYFDAAQLVRLKVLPGAQLHP